MQLIHVHYIYTHVYTCIYIHKIHLYMYVYIHIHMYMCYLYHGSQGCMGFVSRVLLNVFPRVKPEGLHVHVHLSAFVLRMGPYLLGSMGFKPWAVPLMHSCIGVHVYMYMYIHVCRCIQVRIPKVLYIYLYALCVCVCVCPQVLLHVRRGSNTIGLGGALGHYASTITITIAHCGLSTALISPPTTMTLLALPPEHWVWCWRTGGVSVQPSYQGLMCSFLKREEEVEEEEEEEAEEEEESGHFC